MGAGWRSAILFLDVHTEVDSIWVYFCLLKKGDSKMILVSVCIRLDTHNLIIPLTSSKAEIIRILQDNGVNVDFTRPNFCVFKSTLFSLNIIFCIAIRFENEKVISVSIAPESTGTEENAHLRYKLIQRTLEKKLGRVRNPIHTVINHLDPDNMKNSWKYDGITIKHFLECRFGIEETILIEL